MSSYRERFAKSEALCGKIVDRFQLIANKSRFRILCLLQHGWFSVNEIVDVIQAGKLSNVSQQLKLLSLAGVLEKRKESRQVFYTLKDESVRKTIRFLENLYLEDSP